MSRKITASSNLLILSQFSKYNFLAEYLKMLDYEIAHNDQIYHHKRGRLPDIVAKAGKKSLAGLRYFRWRILLT